MRIISCIVIAFLLFAANTIQAQETPSTKPPERSEQLLLDITWDHLFNLPDSVELQPWSRGVNVYGMYDMPLGSGKVSAGLGGGFSSSNYFSNSVVSHITDSLGNETSYFQPLPADSSYKRTKLSVNYVDAAAELRFRIPNKAGTQAFKFAIGARVGYLVNAHSKLLTDNRKYKDYYLPNVRQWRYGAIVRLGYGKVNLFGAYNVSTLFEENKGTALNPLTIGISLAPF